MDFLFLLGVCAIAIPVILWGHRQTKEYLASIKDEKEHVSRDAW